MNDFVTKANCISILNVSGAETLSYYSADSNAFEFLTADDDIPDDYVKAPYVEEITSSTMYVFWNKLGKDIMNIPRTRNRFLAYLDRHELGSDYICFENKYSIAYMKVWAEENDIVLNWGDILIL